MICEHSSALDMKYNYNIIIMLNVVAVLSSLFVCLEKFIL